MTKLPLQGPRLVRETATLDRDGPIVVELAGRYLAVRIKGLRSEDPLLVQYDVLLDWLRKREYQKTGRK
jgi:hypothetical protein